MNIVLLQVHLSQPEFNQLLKEFPQYIFLSLSEFDYKRLSNEDWARVEILFGDRLTCEELEKAHLLRWIHSPIPQLDRICVEDIKNKGNILITNTKEENVFQISEYVIAGILAFTKLLFQWKEADEEPDMLWDSKWRNKMWTLEGRKFLQIGLGRVGSDIARRAKQLGMKVWGVTEQKSFHEHCDKIYTYPELHAILPAVDVISITMPKKQMKEGWLGRKELELMRHGSILSIIGDKRIIDETALAELAAKFRGVLFDANYKIPILPSSPLWGVDNLLITPEVSPRPKNKIMQSTKIFRYNLRQYQFGNINIMKNVVIG